LPTLLCALFFAALPPAGVAGHIYVCMPPLFRIDAGKEVFYALDEAESEKKTLKRIASESPRTKPVVTVSRFGRNESVAVARTTWRRKHAAWCK